MGSTTSGLLGGQDIELSASRRFSAGDAPLCEQVQPCLDHVNNLYHVNNLDYVNRNQPLTHICRKRQIGYRKESPCPTAKPSFWNQKLRPLSMR